MLFLSMSRPEVMPQPQLQLCCIAACCGLSKRSVTRACTLEPAKAGWKGKGGCEAGEARGAVELEGREGF